MSKPHITGTVVCHPTNPLGDAHPETKLILHDGSRGYLEWESMTADGAVPFVYTSFHGDEAPPPLWLPLVGVRLFEDTP